MHIKLVWPEVALKPCAMLIKFSPRSPFVFSPSLSRAVCHACMCVCAGDCVEKCF